MCAHPFETVVPASEIVAVVQTIRQTARTGRPGDGKIFVIAVEQAIRIRDDDSDREASS